MHSVCLFGKSANCCTGCVTCRSARIKCDETQPHCKQCHRRGVKCGGYQVKLKWVEIFDVSPDNQATGKSVIKPRSSLAICSSSKHSKQTQSKETDLSTSIIRNPSTGPRLHSSSDTFVFSHWAQSLPDLVYPNPEEYISIREPYLAFVWQEDSILLPAALASGASHLYALGILSQADVLERKQRALSKIISCVQQKKLLSESPNTKDIPMYISEEAIAASLALIGLEVMQGSDTALIRPLIRGMRAQLEERQRLLKEMDQSLLHHKPTPMMSVNIKMMAYMDALSCVPCARKPVLDRQFWRETVLIHFNKSPKGSPDVVFGYTADILPLIGDSASLVNDFLSGAIEPEAFSLSRCCLFQELTLCCRDLPAATQQPCSEGDTNESPESCKIRNSNACIAAALAHGLATQIFLLRADDGDSNKKTNDFLGHPLALVEQLSNAISAVPHDTYASTMMIWPMFVLGCETMPSSSRRHTVELMFEKMIEKHRLLNISVALELLRNKLWKIGDTQKMGSSEEDVSLPSWSCQYSSSDWVRACWREKLQLCTA
ncbi:uncharacterized protein CTRU02_200842 [Colletotrichum truncatum]|uniref:Uncharacterized protein n=1 Tax=Colletotrichum truncatum TaxID=5467 RepID=A0ACC3ZFS4_COLTU|nr:uncharacterized protein CTRU02_00608 [Colletotrichum truncatum]KAF6801859.1 hypothetical protein CTRU02_00608 [Colletotrichum truncatum]